MGLTMRDVARFGPKAQRQLLEKCAAAQVAGQARENKYHARAERVVLPDGSVREFDSAKEARRFRELDMLQKAGEISDLRCQVPFVLIPAQVRADGSRERACKYVADFVYIKDGETVVEDVKGYTRANSLPYRLFVVKRKLMLWVHGIAVREI